MKIIFLDIDGVITSARTGWVNWDPFATTFVKWCCEKSDTKIVISSTWRCNRDRKFFTDIFGENAIHEDWRTPWDLSDMTMNCRGDEIQKWLTNHPEIEDYVIIDDEDDMLERQVSHLMLTNSYNGMMFDDYEKLRKMLNFKHPCNLNIHTIIMHPNMFWKDQ